MNILRAQRLSSWFHRRGWFVTLSAIGVTGLTIACTSDRRIQRVGERTYRVECSASLVKCLEQVERPCAEGYKIVEGVEERHRYGIDEPGLRTETWGSRATVKCLSRALIGGDEDEETSGPRLVREPSDPAPAASSGPVLAPREPVCVPGSTQACIGVGGCNGGQSCDLSGTAYGACICAPAPAESGTAVPAVSGGGETPQSSPSSG